MHSLKERSCSKQNDVCRSIDASEGIINNLSSSGFAPKRSSKRCNSTMPTRKKDCRGVSWIRVWFWRVYAAEWNKWPKANHGFIGNWEWTFSYHRRFEQMWPWHEMISSYTYEYILYSTCSDTTKSMVRRPLSRRVARVTKDKLGLGFHGRTRGGSSRVANSIF